MRVLLIAILAAISYAQTAFTCGGRGELTCPVGYAPANKTQCEAFTAADQKCAGAEGSYWLPDTCASGSSTSWCIERPYGCWQDIVTSHIFYNEVPTDDGTAYYNASPICYLSTSGADESSSNADQSTVPPSINNPFEDPNIQCKSWETEVSSFSCVYNRGETPRYNSQTGCWFTRWGGYSPARKCCRDCSSPAPTSTTDPFAWYNPPTYTTRTDYSWEEDSNDNSSAGVVIVIVLLGLVIIGGVKYCSTKDQERQQNEQVQRDVHTSHEVNQPAPPPTVPTVIQIATPPPAYQPDLEAPTYNPQAPPAYEPDLDYQSQPPAYDAVVAGIQN